MSNKRAKKLVIGTRNGTFCCDEALACAILKCLPRYKDATIVRTQDQNILDKCDIVVGVGGVYDPSTHRYDYHVEGFWQTARSVLNKCCYDNEVTLTSAPLIFCHFGHEMFRTLCPQIKNNRKIEKLFKNMYNNFIVKNTDENISLQKYSDLCPVEEPGVRYGKKVSEDKIFEEAMRFQKCNFLIFANHLGKQWYPGETIVRNAVNNRFKVDPSGEIIELSRWTTWEGHLFDLEREVKLSPSIKFAIMSERRCNRAECASLSEEDDTFRMPFPDEWAGLHNDALVAVCGIKDAIFVREDRYMAQHKTRRGVLAMVKEALRIGNSHKRRRYQ